MSDEIRKHHTPARDFSGLQTPPDSEQRVSLKNAVAKSGTNLRQKQVDIELDWTEQDNHIWNTARAKFPLVFNKREQLIERHYTETFDKRWELYENELLRGHEEAIRKITDYKDRFILSLEEDFAKLQDRTKNAETERSQLQKEVAKLKYEAKEHGSKVNEKPTAIAQQVVYPRADGKDHVPRQKYEDLQQSSNELWADCTRLQEENLMLKAAAMGNSTPTARSSNDIAKDMEFVKTTLMSVAQEVKRVNEESNKSIDTRLARRGAMISGSNGFAAKNVLLQRENQTLRRRIKSMQGDLGATKRKNRTTKLFDQAPDYDDAPRSVSVSSLEKELAKFGETLEEEEGYEEGEYNQIIETTTSQQNHVIGEDTSARHTRSISFSSQSSDAEAERSQTYPESEAETKDSSTQYDESFMGPRADDRSESFGDLMTIQEWQEGAEDISKLQEKVIEAEVDRDKSVDGPEFVTTSLAELKTKFEEATDPNGLFDYILGAYKDMHNGVTKNYDIDFGSTMGGRIWLEMVTCSNQYWTQIQVEDRLLWVRISGPWWWSLIIQLLILACVIVLVSAWWAIITAATERDKWMAANDETVNMLRNTALYGRHGGFLWKICYGLGWA